MSLATPDKIRDLQIKLYRKAKDEPEFRFYQLYDKVYREDILWHAYELARANQGAPGVDGESFEDIESAGLEEWMNGLRKDLHDKTYEPQPVRRKMIPKPGGGERALGIPTIRDRVAQTAAKLILEPIWEADLEPNAYGYRPGKSAQDAIQKVDELLHAGYTDVVEGRAESPHPQQPHAPPGHIRQWNRLDPPHRSGVEAKADRHRASHPCCDPVRIQPAGKADRVPRDDRVTGQRPVGGQ